MTTEDARRERNRRRWRRRRVRRLAALLVMLPLLVGAGLLGSNAVTVLGTPPEVAEPDRLVTQPRKLAQRVPARTRRPRTRSGSVPITIPVPQPYDVSKMKTVSAETRVRYVETGSHLSPSLRREASRLMRIARGDTPQVIVLAQRSITPAKLTTVNAIFTPTRTFLFNATRFEDEARWARIDDQLELSPDVLSIGTGSGVPVPEPTTGLLVASGLSVLAARGRRPRR